MDHFGTHLDRACRAESPKLSRLFGVAFPLLWPFQDFLLCFTTVTVVTPPKSPAAEVAGHVLPLAPEDERSDVAPRRPQIADVKFSRTSS